MSTPKRSNYHHGDLRATLLTVAMQMLESGDTFSLRAVARRAGVSPTAPYRHFADRHALESALAAQGFRDLHQALAADDHLPSTPTELVEFGVAYVGFALRRPVLFRVMFGGACDDTDDERVQAVAEVHALLGAALAHAVPGADAAPMALACWALAHGLACLHLDGKLPTAPRPEVDDRVRQTFAALLAAHIPVEPGNPHSHDTR